MYSIPTPHIEAKNVDDFAKTVLMPGDPKRAEWIANNFLQDVRLVTSVRGMLGFTGTYKDKKVSVMASGMGCPSMGIYSYELFKFYDVDKIIRIGTCGTHKKELNLGDIIVAEKTITDSNYCNMIKKDTSTIEATKALVKKSLQIARKMNINANVGNIFCTDTFYNDEIDKKLEKCIAVEMESASLYFNAKKLSKKALTICSVSDNSATHKSLTSLEREKNLKKMIEFALELV